MNRSYSLIIRCFCLRRATPSKWPTETTFAVAVGHRNGVVQALTLEHMYRGKCLHVVGSYLMLQLVRFAHFLSSIEVGDAIRCCSGCGKMNGHNEPPAWHRFDHSMKGVLGFLKHPQLPEAELYWRRNTASAAMVRLVDGKKRAPEIGPETS